MSGDVRERLRRLEQLHGRPAFRRPEAPPEAPDTVAWGLEECLPGLVEHTAAGECFVAQSSFPLDYRHGPRELGEALEVPPRAWALLARDAALAGLDVRRAAFVDTETTGLAGGTGTYVFLVGLGFFDEERFVVRQYFMRDHSQEEAMLRAVAAFLPRFDAWVSFNGKSFDLPLLETRLILSDVQRGLDALPHLDLLFPARRLLRGCLDSFRLSSLEADYLGVFRRGDVPGAEVPRLYFDFLRRRRPEPLVPVFYHNSQDILSLVTLAAALVRRFESSGGAGVDDPLELANLGRSYEEAGQPAQAAVCYERAAARMGPSPLLEEIQVRLALAYKRCGHWQGAVDLWERLAAAGGRSALGSLVELAKYHEHRTRDLMAATRYAQRALDVAAAAAQRPTVGRGDRVLGEVEHRLSRLYRKAARAGAGAVVDQDPPC